MRYSELPPLAFLPAVEAAGRLGSFKAAALELHVTPSAVSQQVKAVEEALGAPLFERRGRSVVLRPEGARYLHDVRQTLRELLDAGRRVRRNAGRNALNLNTVPFVAHEFLLPRMPLLRSAFPELDLALETSMRLVDFHGSEVDATIRLGAGPWPALTTRPFGVLQLALVCAPALARKIRRLEDLANHPILEIRSLQERALGNVLKANDITPLQVQTFESYFETVRAAEHGLGVAVGFFPLTTHWVTSGRLAVPLDFRAPMPGYIALLHRHGDDGRLPFAAFADWLTQQFLALPPLPAGRIVPGAAARKVAQARAARTRG
jgi:LysR family glycine cleavage system transcriptional activator